jgi:hypothetical protein
MKRVGQKATNYIAKSHFEVVIVTGEGVGPSVDSGDVHIVSSGLSCFVQLCDAMPGLLTSH